MKFFTSLFILLLPIALLSQAPANDDCPGIINLGDAPYCSGPAQYTNVNATASNIDPTANVPACFNNGTERDVWFQFTAPADGSITEVTITVAGIGTGTGTMLMPQVAIYRGSCTFGDLAELNCSAAPLNSGIVRLDQFGLTPGLDYFLRINDYSATAAPNWGTFQLCIEKYVPFVNMGDITQTGACTGTLFDSGGENDDYSIGEDLTFTICPQTFHQCIVFNIESYGIQQNFDYLRFYEGSSINDTEITSLTGNGSNFEVQIAAPCATIRFQSDNFLEDEGFKITWQCSPDACTTPPPTTCNSPVVVTMPYQADNLNNCFSGNTVTDGPCDDDFLTGNDYIFTYTSPGDECLRVAVTGANEGAGVAIFSDCPDLAGAECIASVGGGFATFDPTIQAAFLENPGTYYIVFGSGDNCSGFNIAMDTVGCPIVLPPASTCDNALDIGGCNTNLPETIALNPGDGDPNFIQDGVNAGCFVNPQENFSFFFFRAASAGKFGFVVQSADPAESSDIDINVWGPIPSLDDICDYVINNQPIRSTWAPGDDPTGLADVNPVNGLPVFDEYDCGDASTPGATGDDFVKTIDVQPGEIYVILLDDYGEAIEQGGISIDFSPTTANVFAPDINISVSPDTAVCPGQSVQLFAAGGEAYAWQPNNPTISCTNCQTPTVTPTETTSYQVEIATTCKNFFRLVDVYVFDVNLGPDITVCNNAEFQLNPNPFDNVQYNWTGVNLSCNDCPSPTVSGLTTGVYAYTATMTTPLCVLKDTLIITVVNGEQPDYNIANDQIVCAGQTVSLGGAAVAGVTYEWSSNPSGFASTDPNPSATPTNTTTYYLSASNISCPFASVDSVLVTVYQPPALQVAPDATICLGQGVLLGTTPVVVGDVYQWSPNDGSLDDPNNANPTATPTNTTTYILVASNPGCQVSESVTLTVTPIGLELDVEDTVRICQGTTLDIVATPTPPGDTVLWSPNFQIMMSNLGQNASVTPYETTIYTATVVNGVCSASRSVFVAVDSLPDDMRIFPMDTTICIGARVLLTSPIYEPAEYKEITFLWEGDGQLTPDSLYNMFTQPNDTVRYQRIVTNGACVDTQFATVNVIVPPPMSVVPDDARLCPGESVALTLLHDPAVMDIEWQPSEGLSCSDCDNPTATPSVTTNYQISGTYKGCPTNTSVAVVVKPLPQFKFPDDRSLCGGQSATLNEINDPGTNYTWTSTDPTFGTVTTAQPTVTPTQNQTYFMQAEKEGCTAQDQLTLTVFNATLTVGNDTTICKNFSARLVASGTLPGTYEWNPGNLNGSEVQVQPDQTTVFTVTYRYGDDCQLTDQVTVNVAGEAPTFQFPNDTQLCPGESATLNNDPSPNPNATYTWTSTPPGFNSTSANPTVTPTVTTTYRVTSQLGQCTNIGEITITAHKATLSVSKDTTICDGTPATLIANGTGDNSQYAWSNGENTPSISVSPSSTTTYDVDYTYGDGCQLMESVKVTVVPSITVSIACDPDTNRLDVGDPIELTADIEPSQSLNGFRFEWTELGQSGTQATTQVFNPNTSRNFGSEEDSVLVLNFTVRATSPIGCTDIDSKSITLVREKIAVPNAFTPGPDSTNSTFGLILLRGKVSVEKMQIYTRWGEKVFEGKGLNPRWDGTDGNGNELPMDVYIYYIQYRRGDGALQPPLHGDVTLLR